MNPYLRKAFPVSLFIFALAPLISGLFFESYPFLREEYYMFFGGTFLILLLILHLSKSTTTSISINVTDIIITILGIYICVQKMIINSDLYSTNIFHCIIFLNVCYFAIKIGFHQVLTDYKKEIVNLFIILFLIVGIFQTVYGFLQLFNWLPNLFPGFAVGGSLGNPGVFAIYIGTFVPFALGSFIFNQDNKILKYFSLIALILFIGLLPFTLSRTSWIASLVGSLYILNSKFNIVKYFLSIKQSYKILIAICITVSLIIVSFNLYNFKKRSSDGRVLIWKISRDIVSDNLIFGVGVDDFVSSYNTYQVNYFKQKKGSANEKILAGKVPFAFNDYLQSLIETGVVGLLAFVSLLISVFRFKLTESSTVEKKSYVIQLARGSLITILVAALFAYPFQVVPQLALFYILFAVASAGNNGILELHFSKWIKIICVLLLSICLCFFQYFEIRKYIACINWYKGFTAIQQNKKPEAEAYYTNSLPVLRNHTFFSFNYAYWLFLNKKYTEAVTIIESIIPKLNTTETYLLLGDIYLEIGEYKKAEAAYIYCTNLYPSLFRPNYQLFRVYNLMGENEKAKEMAKKLVDMDTKILGFEVQQIKLEMIKFLSDH